MSGPANTTVSAITSNGVLTVSGLTSGTTTLTVSLSVSGIQVASVQVPVVTNALPALAALPVALPTNSVVGSVVSLSNVCGTTALPILSGITGTDVLSTSLTQTISVLCQDLLTGCVSTTSIITIPPGLIPTLSVLPSIVCVGTPLSLTLLPGSLPLGITDLTNGLVSIGVSGPANTTVSAITSNGVLTVSGLTSGTTTLTVSLSVSGIQVASVQVPVVTNALPALAALPVALPTNSVVGSVVSLSNVCGTTALPILSGITGTDVLSTSLTQTISVLCQDLLTGCVSTTSIITIPPGLIPTLSVLPSIVCVGTPLSLTLLPGSLPLGITDLTNGLVSIGVSGPANTTVSAITSNGVLTVSGLTSGTTTLTVSLSVSGIQVASVQVPVVTNALPALAALPVALPTNSVVGSVVSLSNVCGTTALPILSGITGTDVLSTSLTQTISVLCQDLLTGCVSTTSIITIPPGLIPTLSVLPSIVCVGQPLSLTLLPGSLPLGITDLTNGLVSVGVSGPANTTVSAITSNGVLTVSGLTSGTTTLTVSLSVSGIQVASVQVPVVTNALPALAALPVALPTTLPVGSVVSLSNVCGTTALPILSGITGTDVLSTSLTQTISVLCQDLLTGCVSTTSIITIPPGLIPTLSVLPSIVCVGQPLSLTLLPGSLPLGITDLTSSLVSVGVSGPANTTVSAITSNGVLTVSGLTSGTTTLTVSLSVSGIQVASVQVPVVTNALPALAALPVALPTNSVVGSVVSLSNVCGTTALPILSGITGTDVLSTSLTQTISVLCQDLLTGCVSTTSIITIPPGLIPTLSVLPSIVCVGQPLSLTLLPGSLPLGITDLTNGLVSVGVSGPANTTVSAITSNGVLTVSGLTSGTTTLTVSLSVSGIQVASVQVPVVTNALPALAALPVALPTNSVVGSVVSLSNVCGTTALPILSGITGTDVLSTSLTQTISVLCQDLLTGCVSTTSIITIPPGLIPTLSVLPSIVCVGQPLSLTLLPGSLPLGITDLTNGLVSVGVSGPANTTVSAITSNGVLTVSGLTSGTTTLTVSLSVSGIQVASVQVPVVTNALPALAALPVALPTTLPVGSVVSLSNVCGTTALPILSGITGTDVLSTSLTQTISVLCQDLLTGCVSTTSIITIPPGLIPTLSVLPSIVCVGTPLSLTLLPGSLPLGITDLTNGLVSIGVSGPANTTVSAINSNGVLTVSGLTSGTTTLTVSVSVSGVQIASVQVPVTTLALPALPSLAGVGSLTGLTGSVVSLTGLCATGSVPVDAALSPLTSISLTSATQSLTVLCQSIVGGCLSTTSIITIPSGLTSTLTVLPSIVCVGTPLSLTLLPGSLPLGITDLTSSLVSVGVSGPANTTVSAITSNGVLTVSGLTSGTTTLTVSLSVSGIQVASVQVPVVTNALPALAALPVALPTNSVVGSVVSLSNVCGTTALPILSGITGTDVLSTSLTQTISVLCQDLLTGCVSTTSIITIPPGLIPTLSVLPSIVCVGQPLSLTLLPGSLPLGITDLTNGLVSVGVSGPANTTVSAITSNGVLTVSGLTSGTTTLTVSLSVSGIQVASVQVPVVTNALPALAALPVALPTTLPVGSVVSLSNVCGTTALPILSGITGTDVLSTSLTQTISVLCQDLLTGCVSTTSIITIPPGLIPTLSVLPSIVCVGTPLSLTLLPGSLPLGITDLTNGLVSIGVSGPANTTVSAINSNGVLTVSGLTSGTTTLTVSVSVSGVQIASVQVPVTTLALPALPSLAGVGSLTGLTGSVVSLTGLCATGSVPVDAALSPLTSISLTSATQSLTVLCQSIVGGCLSTTSIITIPSGLTSTLTVLPSIVCVGTPLSLTLLPGSLPLGITDLTSSLVSVGVSGPANTTVSAITSNGVLTVSGLTSGTTTLTVSLSVSGIQVASVQVPVVTNALPALAALPVALPTNSVVGSVVSLSNVCGTTALPILSGITGTDVLSTSLTQTISVLCQDLLTGCVSTTSIITIPPGLIPTLSVLPSIVCVGQPLSLTLLPGSLPLGITDLTNGLVSVGVSGPANTTVSAITSNGVLTVSGLTSGTTTLTVSLSVSGIQVASVQVPVVTNALPALAALPVALPTTLPVGSVVSLSNVCGTTALPILSGITGTDVLSTSLTQTISVLCQDLLTGCVSTTSIITIPPGLIPTLSVLPSIVCVGTPLSLTLLPGSLPLGITDLTNGLVSIGVSGPANTTVSAINSNGVLTVSGLTSGTTTLTVSVSVSGVQIASVQVPVTTLALPALPSLAGVGSLTGLTGSVVSLTGLCATGSVPVDAALSPLTSISLTSATQSLTVLCQSIVGGCLSTTSIITIPSGLTSTLTVLPSIVCVGTPLSLTLLPGSLPLGITDLTSSLVSIGVSGPVNTTVSAITSNGVLTVSGLTSGTTTLTVSVSVSGVQIASVQVPVTTLALPALPSLAGVGSLTGLTGSVVSLTGLCATGSVPVDAALSPLTSISLTSATQSLTVLCQSIVGGCLSTTSIITIPSGLTSTLTVLPSIVCVGTPLSLTLLPGSLPLGITDLTSSLVSIGVSGPVNTTVSAINSNGVLTVSGLTSGTTTLTVSVSVSGVQIASVQVPVVTNALPAAPIAPVNSLTGVLGSVVSLSNVCGTTALPILSGITGTSVVLTSVAQTISVLCQDLLTGCVSTTSIITIPPGIIPPFTLLPLNPVVCIGNPLSVTVTGLGSLSSLVTLSVTGGVASLTQTGDVITLSGLLAGPQTLTLTATLAGAVPVSVPLNLTVLAPLAPVYATSQTLVQGAGNVALSTVGCAPGETLIFSNGTGIINTTLPGITTLTVSCQSANALCVSAPLPITVVVPPTPTLPTPILLPATLAVCLNSPVSITVTGLQSITAIVNFALTGGNGTLSQVGNVLTLTNLPTGVQTLTLTASALGYVSVSVPVSVTVYNPTAPSIAGGTSQTVTQGTTALLSASCATGTPVYAPSASINTAATGVFTYSVTCQDGPCVSPATLVSVTVAPVVIPILPTPIFSPSAVVACSGTPVSVTVSGLSSVTSAVSFVSSAGTVSYINNVLTISGLPTGVQTLTLTASAAGYNSVSVPLSVTVYNPTAPAISGGNSQTVVQFTTLTLLTSCQTGGTAVFSPSAINTANTGVFTYSVTCQDGPCISPATTVTVTVTAPPTPVLPPLVLNPSTVQVCLGSPVSVTVNAFASTYGTVVYTASSGALTQSGNVLTISGLPAGVQTLTLTASAAGFGSVSAPLSVTVYNPTAPVVAGGTSQTVIQGTTALLSASCATGTPVYAPSASINTATTSVFTYSVTCQDGPCVSPATLVTITVAPVPTLPTPVLTPSALQACLGSPVSVTVSGLSSVTNAVTYSVSSGTLTQSGNVLTITGLPAGVQTLTLTASTVGYTSVSVPVSVTVYNPTTPTIAAGTALTVAVGAPSSLIPVLCATGTPVYRDASGNIVTTLPTNVAGAVSYTATCQDGPCISTGLPVRVIVQVPLIPLPPITLNPATIQACLGSPVSVTVNGLGSLSPSVSYVVSGSATLAQSGSVLTFSNLPTGVQTLTLTASLPGYTSVSIPVSVTVYNPTAPTIAGGNSLTIGQGTIGALLSASCATGTPNYLPSNSIATGTTGVFTYTVTCQAGPCTSPPTTVTVTINANILPSVPTPIFSPSVVAACLGSPVSVTVSGLSSVTSAVSFASSAGTVSYINNVLTITGLPAGVQTLTLTASAAGYTSVSVPVSVTVFNPTAPVVAGGTSQTVTQGTTALLSASCATGTVVYAPSASINTATTGVFTYSVTCQDGPCVSPATLVTVTVAPVVVPVLPTPVLTPSALQACLGSPVSVTVSGLSSVTTAITYTVSSGAVTQSGNVLTITGLPAGVQTLTLTASAAGYTSVSVPVSVTVFNPTAPVVAGGTSQTVTQGTTALLSASCATGSVVYAPSASINTAATGVFTYSVTCQDGPCVSPATLVTVTVAPVVVPVLPTPVLTPSALQACLGSPVSVTVSGLSSVTTAITYTVSSGAVTQSGNVLTITGLPAGVQTLTLTASAAGYTSVSVPVSVTVYNPTAPVVAGGTSQTVTQGTTALLSASCATGTVVYAPSASINTSATGVFTYSVTCQDGPCVSPATLVSVTVAPVVVPVLPTPVLTPSALQACLGSPVSVTVSGLSSVTTAITYTVSSGAVTQSGNVLTITGLPAGVQTLTLTASAAGYTSVSVPVSVTVYNPTAPIIAGGNSLTVGQGSVGAMIMASCATTSTPVFTPSATINATTAGVFTYSVTCQDGPCVSPATTVTVTVTPSIQPAVPTPILNPTALQACPGTPVSVTVSGLSSVTSTVTYTLTGGGTLAQSGNMLTISGLPAGVQTLTLTASAAGYTSTSIPVSITVGAPSIPVITGGNSQTVDQGTVAVLAATCATGTPVYTPSNLINAETPGVKSYTVICQQGACQSAPVVVTITVRPSVAPVQCGTNLDGTPLRATAPVYDCALITTTGEIRFTGAGGNPNGGPIEFMAIGVTNWTTNCVVYIDRETRTKCDAAPIEIRIRQLVNGTYVVGSTYVFDIRRLCPAGCPAPNVNRAPVVLGGIPNQTGQVGTPFLFEIPRNAFSDPDGNNLVYVVNPTPPGGGIFTSSGLFYGTPQVAGVQTLTVTAYDNYGGSVTTTFTITILPAGSTVPNLPKICNSGTIDGSPLRATVPMFNCQQLTTTGEIQFAGAGGNPNGGPVEFMASGITGWTTNCQAFIDAGLRSRCDVPPIEIQIRQLVNGTYVYGTSYFFNLRQVCPVNGCVTPPTNRPPVVSAGIPDQTGKVGTAFSYQIPANAFSDPDADPLMYTVSALPAGVSFTNGVFSGVPQVAATTSVTVTASDGKGGSVSTVFRISVTPADTVTPPTPGTLCGSSSLDGTPLRVTTPIFDCAQITTTGEIRFTAAGGNPNGGPIEFMSVGITNWTTNCQAFVDRETRRGCDAPAVEIRARQLVNGTYVYGTPFVFDIRRLCPIAGCSTPPTQNRPPVVSAGIPDQTGKVGTAFSYQIPANAFSDPDGNTLAYLVSATPAGISASSGQFSGTPQVAGTTSITVTAVDGFGGSVTTVFRITVMPANSPDPVTPTPTTPIATSGCGSVSLDGTTLRATVPDYDCAQLASTGAIRFTAAGGNPNGSPVEFMALGITDWTTNCRAVIDQETRTRCDAPAVEIRVRQMVNGTYVYGTPFVFDIRRLCPIAGCSTPPTQNRPPVVMNTIPDQYGKVGVAFNYQIPQNVFFDADGNYLVYSVNAVPAGISFSGDLLSGTPQVVGTTSVTLTAFDGYGGMVATSFRIIIDRFVTTSQPTPATGATSRVAAPESEESPINVRVFGNPTANETIDFDIEGAAGKAVRLIVVDSNGRTASEHTVENAAAVEHQTMKLGQSAGMYLLRVSTGGQSKTVKIIKQ